jgi:hypothetical protein
VTVSIDNTECNKDIDKIKLKLTRNITAFSIDGMKFTNSSVVNRRTYDGISAGKKD